MKDNYQGCNYWSEHQLKHILMSILVNTQHLMVGLMEASVVDIYLSLVSDICVYISYHIQLMLLLVVIVGVVVVEVVVVVVVVLLIVVVVVVVVVVIVVIVVIVVVVV